MRKWLQGILMIISIVLISISIYSLMGMYGDYHKEHQIHEHLIRLHELDRKPSEKKNNNNAVAYIFGILVHRNIFIHLLITLVLYLLLLSLIFSSIPIDSGHCKNRIEIVKTGDGR